MSASRSHKQSSGVDTCSEKLRALDAKASEIKLAQFTRPPNVFIASEYAEANGLTTRTASRRLRVLLDKGLVKRVRTGVIRPDATYGPCWGYIAVERK